MTADQIAGAVGATITFGLIFSGPIYYLWMDWQDHRRFKCKAKRLTAELLGRLANERTKA